MAMAIGAGCGCGVVGQKPREGHLHVHQRLDANQQWSRALPACSGTQGQWDDLQCHPQSTQILHNMLSMKVQRRELVAESPPGHSYGHVPEDMISNNAQVRFPTPPSSLPSSPEPHQNYFADFSGYGSSGCSSNRSSPFSTYSMDNGQDSPRTSSPGTSCSTGISRVYRYRRSQNSSREASQSPAYSSGNSTILDEDQPVNLRKRQHSPPPTEYWLKNQFEQEQLETGINDEGNKPMDLSIPSKKQKIRETSLESSWEMWKSTSDNCYQSRLDSPLPSTLASSLKEDDYQCQPHHHDQYNHMLQRQSVNPHLAYHPEKSLTASAGMSSASILKSILCGELSSKSILPTKEDLMDDLPTESPLMYTLSNCQGLTRSPAQRVSDLIRRAKMKQQSHKSSPDAVAVVVAEHEQGTQSSFPEQAPLILSHPPSPPSAALGAAPSLEQSRNTVVSLAKKNLLPVTARISDWLVKVVQYAKSLPEFSSLPVNDKVTLIQSSWSRLLLLKMAEFNFQFAVNPCPASTPPMASLSDDVSSASIASVSSPWMQPTLESVEGIVGFVGKCQTLGITVDEMSFLRLLTLFNPSHMAVESSSYIEKINTYVRKRLQESCVESGGAAGNRRYCQLLLVLPPLFGVRPEVMESLFCKHITTNTDMDLLLKEMLHKL